MKDLFSGNFVFHFIKKTFKVKYTHIKNSSQQNFFFFHSPLPHLTFTKSNEHTWTLKKQQQHSLSFLTYFKVTTYTYICVHTFLIKGYLICLFWAEKERSNNQLTTPYKTRTKCAPQTRCQLLRFHFLHHPFYLPLETCYSRSLWWYKERRHSPHKKSK